MHSMEIKTKYPRLFKCYDGIPLFSYKNGRTYLINSLTDHMPVTNPELLKEAIDILVDNVDFSEADVLVGEEEKGGFIVTCLALRLKKEFTLAKQNPTRIPGEIGVDFAMAYNLGMKLYINGLTGNKKAIIVDDMIDTGGTIVALINALRSKGVKIIDVVVLVERVDAKGVLFVEEQTGIKIKTLIKVHDSSGVSRVT